MRVAALAVLALAGDAMADAPQVAPLTAELVVTGWDIRTHAIVYTEAHGYTDTWACEEARVALTPESGDIIAYTSVCISPTDSPS